MRSLLLCLVAATSGFCSTALAQTYTWIHNDNGNWSTASNWLGAMAPPPGGGVGFELIFTNSATLIPVPPTIYTATNDLTGLFQLTNLDLSTRFGANTFSGYLGLSVGGVNGIEFVASGPTMPQIEQNGAAIRLALPMMLSANTTITGSGHGHLFITGAISGPSAIIIDRSSGYTGINHVLGNQLGFYGGHIIINNASNSFAGGVIHNGGNLSVSVTSATATPLGTGSVVVNGTPTQPASLRFDTFSTNPLPNNFVLNSPLFITGTNSGTFDGNFSGSGDLVSVGVGINLNNPISLTGRLVADGGPFRSSFSPITLRNNATALNISGAVIGPINGITLDNSGMNVTNRLPDTLEIVGSRGQFQMTGSSSANSSETVGRYIGTGFETIALTQGSGFASVFTFADSSPIERRNSARFFFRGVGMGSALPGTSNTTSVVLSNTSAVTAIQAEMIGESASIDSLTATDVPILPWAVGHLAATGNPSRFVTYHSTFGFRPLPDSQFAPSITDGSVTKQNIRLTGSAVTINSPTTINSLVIANTSGTGGTTGTGQLTITSSALLSSTSGAGTNATISHVHFPEEAKITVFGGPLSVVTLSAPAGVAKAGTGILELNSPILTSGPFTILSGLVSMPNPDVTLTNVSEIRLNGGVLRALNPSSSASISKPIFVSNVHGQIQTGNPALSQTTDLTISSVIADMPWTSGPYALPGQVSGSVQFGGLGTITLTAANTYSSNTILSASATVIISQENNLGVGDQIIIEGAATLQTTASFTMTKALVLNGGTGAMTISVDSGTVLNWIGPIHQRSTSTQAFALTKAGGGTLILAHNANTQSGLLNINAGTVRLTGNLAPLNSAGLNPFANENYGVIVNPGATLEGTGKTNRVVYVDGTSPGATIAPGVAGSGTLTVNGAFVSSGATLRIAITDGSTPAAINTGGSTVGILPNPTSNTFLYSQASTLTIESGTKIVIDGTGTSFTLYSPYSYRIALAENGTLSPVSITSPSQFSTIGFTADSSSFSLHAVGPYLYLNFTPVPEPAVIAPVVLCGLHWLRRRRSSPKRCRTLSSEKGLAG